MKNVVRLLIIMNNLTFSIINGLLKIIRTELIFSWDYFEKIIWYFPKVILQVTDSNEISPYVGACVVVQLALCLSYHVKPMCTDDL